MQSSPRNGATVRLLAIHTTEGILRVNDLRDWKTWAGSSHATADQFGGFLDGPADGFVAYDRASWTLRSGNPISDNIELCGFAKWSRSDWLARPKLLESAALWLARRKKARPHIPLVKLTPEQVRAGQAGVIGHNDWTVGMKDGSHWDPGPGFPWDVVLTRAQQLYSSTPGSPTNAVAGISTEEIDMTALWETKGSDGRNLFDGIIQTRSELRDRAREGAADALFGTRVQGRNPFDWFIQAAADEAAREAREAARDAALLATVKAMAAGGGVDPAAVTAAAKLGAEQALAGADFPTAAQIGDAVLAAQERAELDRLRARVAELESAG